MTVSLQTPQKILIVRLSAHGDLIQTLPLLSAIKAHHPDHQVSWLVEPSAEPLLQNHPLIHRLHVCRRPQWLQKIRKNPLALLSETVFGEIQGFISELRDEQYQMAFDVQGLLKSAIWPWLAGIPIRAGYQHTREGAAVFYNRHLAYHDLKRRDLPTVYKFMDFMALLESPSLALNAYETLETQTHRVVRYPLPPVSTPNQETVRSWLNELPGCRPTIAIAPSTRWASKVWPIHHWQTMMETLSQWTLNIILLGGPEDEAWVSAVWPNQTLPSNVFNLIGQTHWTHLYGLLPHISLMVGLDSAPLHIANAVASNSPNGLPRIIGLYGPTAAGRTGPIGSQHQTLETKLSCQPCFERVCPLKTNACMDALEPEAVITKIEGLLHSLDD